MTDALNVGLLWFGRAAFVVAWLLFLASGSGVHVTFREERRCGEHPELRAHADRWRALRRDWYQNLWLSLVALVISVVWVRTQPWVLP